MMTKRLCWLLGLWLGCWYGLPAQKIQSLQLGTGTSYYYGDLSDGLETVWLRPSLSLQYEHMFSPHWSLRAGGSLMQVGGSDLGSSLESRQRRALQFRNTLTELSLTGVFTLIQDRSYRIRWKKQFYLSPYFFAGLTGFFHQPRAPQDGNWVRLQPLGTEGQFLGLNNEPGSYNLFQIALPFGLGIRTRLNRDIGLGLELGYRYLFTDYLDDVSTMYPDRQQVLEKNGAQAAYFSNPSGQDYPAGSPRGNPESLDSYVVFQLNFIYYIRR
ncbi:MAG: DUF6089 family protein [Bacteroidota bacterium]